MNPMTQEPSRYIRQSPLSFLKQNLEIQACKSSFIQIMKVDIIHFFHRAQVIFDGSLRSHEAASMIPKTSAVFPKTA
jgi:hypothetical protein